MRRRETVRAEEAYGCIGGGGAVGVQRRKKEIVLGMGMWRSRQDGGGGRCKGGGSKCRDWGYGEGERVLRSEEV